MDPAHNLYFGFNLMPLVGTLDWGYAVQKGTGVNYPFYYAQGGGGPDFYVNGSGNVSAATAYLINGTSVLDNAAWTAWTPTISCATGSITTLGAASGRYKAIGKTVFINLSITITTNGTCAGSVKFTLPVPAYAVAIASGREAGVTGSALQAIVATPSAPYASVYTYANGYPGGNGAVLEISGTYEGQ